MEIVSDRRMEIVSDEAYVYDNSLTEVMVMRNWMEVMLTRVLRILMDPLLFIPRDFRQ